MKKVKLLFVAITMIASYTLTAQGVSINEDGNAADASAMLDVKSTDKGFLPPRLSKDELLLIPNPAEGLVVYNSTDKTLNVFNGSNWVDMMGNLTVEIGDYFRGGVVFYLEGSSGGLICAVSDQDGGSGIQWYNGSFTTTGATATAIGTGQSNTTAIINNQGAGNYAATVCDNYTAGGYADWFLPSKDELNEMYINKAAIDVTAIANGGSGFVSTYYWSSTELDYMMAELQTFNDGNQASSAKANPWKVRAVRAF